MNIEIDQSGKIEQTNKYTVIAFSNGKQKSIMITSKEKHKIQSAFRKIGKPRAFVYQTFNVMIFILIRQHVNILERIVIDREYPGKEKEMKSQIKALFAKYQININRLSISFREIGKKSNAHIACYSAYRKRKADLSITAKEALAILLT